MACPQQTITVTDPYGQVKQIEPAVCPGTTANFMSWTVSLILIAAVVLAFAMLLYGGMQYITSAGDAEKASRAKGRITYALVGLVVSFLSIIIFRVVAETLGLNFIF